MRGSVYDVVVIGAGSVGAPAALSLAQAGLDVLVVDSLPSVGQGSNKAAIGGIRATHSDPAKIRLCQRTIEILSGWEEAHGQEIEWRSGGYVFVAYTPREEKLLQDLLVIQHAYGLGIEWLDAKALLDIVPDLNRRGLIGGTYSPGDGHCSPLLACHAFYDEARRLGATFQFGEEVTGIEVREGRVRAVRTNKGRYGTPVVLNAAGPWARAVGKLVGLDHPVQPDSHEAGVTEPVAHFLAPMVVDTRPAPGSSNYYFHQLASGQFTFCITPQPPILGEDCRETSAFLPMVARRMVDLMPRLGNLRVRRTWRGLYPMTPDGSPLVGWAQEVEGYAMAIGMCGQGVMLGPGLGELLARMITGALLPTDGEVLKILSPYRAFAGQEALR
ncbi:Putative dye-linked L-proline dehydrogenase (PdhB) FAD binding catalytic subunit beta chain [Candidatus Bipolaricaulis anaerobius]|jgi:sarcosine oxidase subunit beta|uniref:Dye-linked L-proline dehydrogenase (PdhB) FAD binding catalytic subunit beta chain n=1 Tax=Candidatus Bipolaricaulis anaerobius TaxID=2026885 RepID=A0A2X3MLD1_9BACT|nr:FAD-dependent oxidoreductase [Candidatus Bipolaricaulis anaerobius]SQD92724.1 Putative dye-linked L-proline dehydrogenase (PdhB) FAD binding catalytic subunit beta chain [Candidatus Bipolaricaulis anaerobius]